MSRITRCGKWSGVACVVVGLILALTGILALANFQPLFRFILGKKVVLSTSSQGYPIWKDVSDHLTTKVGWYFFNLTNPQQVVEGDMPIVEEIGPFWYKTVLTKKNIQFINSNSSVYFEEHRNFQFIREESIADDKETVIHLLNVPLLAGLLKLNDAGYFTRLTAGPILESFSDGLVINMTVRELTYHGKDNTLVALSNAKKSIAEAITALSGAKTGKFGFGVDRNETEPGIFNMYTGSTGVNDLNRIYTMNHKHVLDMWTKEKNNTCNLVDGTFGYLRPPMNESNLQKVYVPDMCRPVDMVYQKDTTFQGIRVRRFILSEDVFASSKKKPDNFCYDKQFNLPSGVSEVGPCKKGAPIVMSQPHFLNADKSYLENVKGLNPDQEKHEFYMDHEPTTGMSVNVRGRLQANLRVQPFDMAQADYLPEVVLPLFWQEMYVEAGPGVVAFLKTVLGYPGLAKIAFIIILLLGFILFTLGVGCIINHDRKTKARATVTSKTVTYSKAADSEPTNGQRPEQDALV